MASSITQQKLYYIQKEYLKIYQLSPNHSQFLMSFIKMFNSNIKLNFILGIYVDLQLLIFISQSILNINNRKLLSSRFQSSSLLRVHILHQYPWSHNFTYFYSIIITHSFIGSDCITMCVCLESIILQCITDMVCNIIQNNI